MPFLITWRVRENECISEIDCRELRVPRVQAAKIGNSFDQLLVLLEKVIHINGWLVGSNAALKELRERCEAVWLQIRLR